MNAITGLPSSGKSTLLNKLHERGFRTFSCDEFISNLYNDQIIIKKLLKNLGMNNQNWRDAKKMIKNELKNRDIQKNIEDFFYEILLNHLKSNLYDFVEIPILKNSSFDFRGLFNNIIFIKVDYNIRYQRALLRYNNVLQVNFIENLDREDFEKYSNIILDGNMEISVENLLKLLKSSKH